MTQQSESQAMAHEATLFVMQMAGDSMRVFTTAIC